MVSKLRFRTTRFEKNVYLLLPEFRSVEGHTLPFCDLYTCPEGEKFDASKGSSLNDGHLRCSCLPQCVVWGNCCYNYHDEHPYNETLERLRVAGRCIDLRYFLGVQFGLRKFSCVSACPEWTDIALRIACEGSMVADTIREWPRLLPVIFDGILFRNKYCMRCHDIRGEPTPLVPMQRDSDGRRYSINDDILISLQKGFYVHTGRIFALSMGSCTYDPCIESATQPVYEGYQNKTSLSNLCDKYHSYITVRVNEAGKEKKRNYYNPFCALCETMKHQTRILSSECLTFHNYINSMTYFKWKDPNVGTYKARLEPKSKYRYTPNKSTEMFNMTVSMNSLIRANINIHKDTQISIYSLSNTIDDIITGRIRTSIHQVIKPISMNYQGDLSSLHKLYTLRNKGSDRVPIGTLGFSFSLRVLIENLLGFWSKQNLS